MSGPRLKRLRYRAWHRGTRELDLILGPFADLNLTTMGPAELDAFETLLGSPDPDIHDWVVRGAAPPASIDRPTVARLRASLGRASAGEGT